MIKRLSDWVKYRTIERNHIIDTGLQPGEYEKSDLLLHASFSILKSYVEDVLSQYYDVGVKHPGKSKPGDGIGFLKLQVQKLNDKRRLLSESPRELDADEQASVDHLFKYERILKLYLWWTEKRSERGDPFEHTGFIEYRRQLLEEHGEEQIRLLAESGLRMEIMTLNRMCDDALFIKDQWEEEDDAMFVELIALRGFLTEPV